VRLLLPQRGWMRPSRPPHRRANYLRAPADRAARQWPGR